MLLESGGKGYCGLEMIARTFAEDVGPAIGKAVADAYEQAAPKPRPEPK